MSACVTSTSRMKVYSCITIALVANVINRTHAKTDNDANILEQLKEMHPLWLRERCSPSIPSDLSDLTVTNIKSNKDEYVAKFSDSQECSYPKDFIVHELANEVAHVPVHQGGSSNLFLWNKNLVSPVLFHYDEVVNQSVNTLKFLSNLLSTGIAVVTNVVPNDGQCARFASTISSVQEMGKVHNVTDSSTLRRDTVDQEEQQRRVFQTDVSPPDFGMIHVLTSCLENSSPLTYNVVDGFRVTKDLCEQDRPAFDVLSTTALRWETRANIGDEDDSSLVYRRAPILEVDGVKEDSCHAMKAVNFNTQSQGLAPKLSKSEMNLFYKAKEKFLNMIRSDEYTVKIQPAPGDLIIFDNRRVLLEPSDSTTCTDMWAQGCFCGRDGLTYLYEHLRRKFSDMTETPFQSLKSAVKADFDRMGVEYDNAVVKQTKQKLIDILEGLKDSYLGQPVSLYEHNVQTASRAYRGGEDDETIFISLFHDVFETLAVKNHGEVIAAMLAPWISPQNHWMLAHHEVFQGYYYFEDYGIDKNKRDMYLDHPVYNQTVNWCEEYDQASFDPDYPSLPLSTFIPVIDRVLARPQYWWNPAHPKAGAVSSASEFNDFSLGKPISECPDTWQCYEM